MLLSYKSEAVILIVPGVLNIATLLSIILSSSSRSESR